MKCEDCKWRPASENDRLLTRQEAAEFLGLKPQTLNKWGMTAEHLSYVKVGRVVRYKLSELQRFIKDRTVPRKCEH